MNNSLTTCDRRTRPTVWRKLVLATVLFFGMVLNAQVTVTLVQNGTSGNSAPAVQANHVSEQIYLSSEMTQSFLINRIGIPASVVGANLTFNPVAVYMRHTALANYVGGGVYNPAGYTLVYSGTLTWTGAGYAYVDLTTPFNYVQASGNLEVMVTHTGNLAHAGYTFLCNTNVVNGGRRNTAPAVPLVPGTTTIPTLTSFRPAFQFMFVPPCTGTPAPGNTTASITAACSGQNINLGIQTGPGLGATYSWERDTGSGFGPFGGTLPTQSTTQTVTTTYRCLVNCPGGGGSPTSAYSTPVTVSLLPGYMCSLCVPNATTSASFEKISNVQYSTVNNSSTATAGYENFLGVMGDAIQGQPLTVITTISGGFAEDEVQIWVDWNHDGTFANDASEYMYLSAQGVGPHTANFSVPGGATLGRTAMRVRMHDALNTPQYNPCGSSGFGQVEDYSLNILAPPPCLPATGVAVIGTSTTTASVSWTSSGTHIVEYGPAATFTTPGTGGSPGAGGTIITSATSPVTIPGLTHPTLYRVFVRRDCTGTAEGYSSNSAGLTFYPTPPNDLCSNAPAPQNLAPGGTINISGNSAGATNTGEPFAFANAWERFTLTGCVTNLEVNWCSTGPGYTAQLNVLVLDCPGISSYIFPVTNLNNCGNGNRRITYGNMPAGTYYLAIYGFGAYTATVIAGPACPPPPPNDLCANAQPISCGQTLAGTCVNATTTGAPSGTCGGMLMNDVGGVWYKAQDICGSVTASLCTSSPAWDTKMFVFTGTCGTLNCVASDDDFCGAISNSQVTWTATAGTDYYIYVLPFDNATTANAFNLSLTCTNTPVAATASVVDNCGSSFFNVFVNITNVGGAGATINWVATPGGPGSMAGAVGSNAIPVNFTTGTKVDVTVSNGATGCSADLGSWYSNCPINLVCGTPVNITHCYRTNDPRTFTFITPTPGETVTVTFTDGQMDPGDVIRAYSGTNNSGTPIPTLTGSFADLFNVTGTSSGQSMFIEIDSPSENTCEEGAQETWVFAAQCTPGCVQPDGSVDENISCATYSFTLDVSVTFTGDGSTTDLEYTVGGVPQPPITGLTTSSPAQTLGPYTIGTSVTVVLAHESDNACDKNLGTFNGTTTFCPPPGWTCALPLDVSSYPYTHSNTTQGTGNDVAGPQCALGANYGGGQDFIYRLNISSAGDYQINMTMPSDAFGGWFLKSNTNCTNTSACIANAVNTVVGGTATGIVNLPVGTYYLIIDSRPLPNFFAYNLQIQQFIPLPGEICSAAINIPSVPTTVSGSTVGYLNNYNGAGCGGFGTDGGLDIVYSYTPPVNQILGLTMCLGTTNYDTKLYVYANTCTGSPVACIDDACSAPLFANPWVSSMSGVSVTAGTTYYIVVDGFSAADFGDYTLQISVLTPPPNDLCSNAQSLAVNTPANCPANAVAGDNSAANDQGTAFSCFTGGPYADVWYTFNSGLNTSVSYSFPTFSFTSILVEVFQGSCVGTSVYCAIGATAVAGGAIPTTPGTNYWIRVASEAGGGGAFTICLNATPPPPANDNCAGAITLPINPLGSCPANAVTGTTVSSTDSAIGDPTCDTGSSHGDVWYTFNSGTNSVINWTFAQGTTNISIVELFTGTCAGLTSVDCDFSFSDISSTWTVTPGTTYYVRVAYSIDFGDTPGTFGICLSNNICTGVQLSLDFETDPFGNETGWEILPIGGGPAVCSGNGLLSNAEISATCCLTNGCYRLRVTDSFGDGMQTGTFVGGYILRDNTGRRIIDNENNFSDWNNPGTQSTTQSAISTALGGGGFCIPMSADRVIFTSCDKMDWRPSEYIVANDNTAVTAVWNSFASGSTQRANSGYEMWFFNPNGGYSFRRFHSHAVSDGFAPANAVRAAHIKLNGWSGNALQNNVLYNVRVRSRLYNVPLSETQWGPACRMKLDPVRAACPLTKLIDEPGHQYFSCGTTRRWGNGQYVHCKPVSKVNASGAVVNANKYQFRFRIIAEGYNVVRTVNNYYAQLNWGAAGGPPLQVGKTYQVDVRASFDGGATWCSDFIAPALVDPWGEICTVTIVSAAQGGGQNMDTDAAEGLRMYPNPNHGDQLTLAIDEIEEGVETVSVDFYDLFGKRLSTRTIPVQSLGGSSGGFINTFIELNGELATGMYMVNITAGERVYIERLVIQH